MALLLACSQDRAGTLPPPPPPTSAAPTTASPTASANYEAEARRAVDAYFVALNAALRDPANRTDELTALIDPSCTCRQVLELLSDLERDAHHIDYHYSVSDVRIQQAGPLGASVTWVVAQSTGAERDQRGSVVSSFRGRTDHYSAHLRRSDGRWLLDRLDRMS